VGVFKDVPEGWGVPESVLCAVGEVSSEREGGRGVGECVREGG
jgi:hypothetical protein